MSFFESESILTDKSDLVLIAQIGAPQGIKGDVRLKSFSDDPIRMRDYGPLCNEKGSRWFEIKSLRANKNKLIVGFKNVNDRNQASELTGTKLYVPRERFPNTEEGEFYHVDLVGLEVVGTNGTQVGKVVAVVDFGAGDLLEVGQESSETVFIPFTLDVVPDVNLDKGLITVDLTSGLLT